MTNQKSEADRHVRDLTIHVDSLVRQGHALEQEVLSQKISFTREINDANQAHATLEGQLRQDLLVKQMTLERLEHEWVIKRAESDRKTEGLEAQIDSLISENQSLRNEMLSRKSLFDAQSDDATQTHAALEKSWASKLRDQKDEADRRAHDLSTQS